MATNRPDLPPGAGAPLVAGPPQSIIIGKPLGTPGPLLVGKVLGGGTAGLITAVVLLLTGLAGPFWPVLAIVAFVAVALVIRAKPRPAVAGFEPDQIHHAMEAQLQAMAGRVPNEVYGKVATIHAAILELLPRVDRLPAGSEDLYILRRIPLDYLPATLDAYLALPRAYAARPSAAGQPPTELLLEQLNLLEAKLIEISDDINAADTSRLLANGRFLQERFGGSELTIPTGIT